MTPTLFHLPFDLANGIIFSTEHISNNITVLYHKGLISRLAGIQLTYTMPN